MARIERKKFTREQREALISRKKDVKEKMRGGQYHVAYSIPKEIPRYKVKEGINSIEIVEYVLQNEKNPLIVNSDYEVGYPDTYFEYSQHQNVGPKKERFCCPKEMYGKACPMCAQLRDLWEEGKRAETEEEQKSVKAKYGKIKPQRRSVFCVLDNFDRKKGMQILDISYAWFTENLEAVIRATEDRFDKKILIGDIDEGYTVEFLGIRPTFAKNPKEKVKAWQPSNFSLVKREEPLDQKWLDETFPLDTYPVISTYEEIKKCYNGEEDDDDDDDEPTVRATRKPTPIEHSVERPKVERPRPKKVETPVCESNCEKCDCGHTFGKDFLKFDDCNGTECSDDKWTACRAKSENAEK